MKSIGQQVKEFRESRGWTWVRMAAEVSKHSLEPVSRVVIKQLEDKGDRMPSYLRALSKTMGVSSDTLLDGLYSVDEGAAMAAEEETAAYRVTTPPEAIQVLRNALLALPPAARESAATLLASMARNPEAQWADWLSDHIRTELSQNDKTNRGMGLPLSNSSVQATTMDKTGPADIPPGPDLQRSLDAGSDEQSKPRGVPKPGAESGH